MPTDILSYRSDIYSAPILAAELSSILSSHNDIVISGQVIVSDASKLVINNTNLVVSGVGSIHQADGVGINFSLGFDQGQTPATILNGNEIDFTALTSWDGVDFTGNWPHGIIRCGATLSNCRIPRYINGIGVITNLVVDNVTGLQKFFGAVESSKFINIKVPTLYLDICGSNNLVEGNRTTEGYTSITFWPVTHITMTGNIVHDNEFLNCDTTEVICYDCDRVSNGTHLGWVTGVNVETGEVTAYKYLAYGLGSDGVNPPNGVIALVCTGAATGKYFYVTAKSSGSVTLHSEDYDLSGVAAGDLISFQFGFVKNKIYNNKWTTKTGTLIYGRGGIDLFGGCVDNEVYDNTGDGNYDRGVIIYYLWYNSETQDYDITYGNYALNSGNNWHDNDLRGDAFLAFTDIYNDLSPGGHSVYDPGGDPFPLSSNLRFLNNAVSSAVVTDYKGVQWAATAIPSTNFIYDGHTEEQGFVTWLTGSPASTSVDLALVGYHALLTILTGSITSLTGTKQSTLTIEGVSGATFGTATYPTDTTWSMEVSGLVSGDNVIIVRAMDGATEVGRSSVTVVYDLPIIYADTASVSATPVITSADPIGNVTASPVSVTPAISTAELIGIVTAAIVSIGLVICVSEPQAHPQTGSGSIRSPSGELYIFHNGTGELLTIRTAEI